ncbi:recombinase RecT [Dysgonomonas macrotermitis]|uniref:Recombination protein RecT n=1 Tax=Dysgonomonas macrotermitis TaxID=1346286 RepID=A0A1M4SD48_9BACT|nr:recombinase RecT [Dysgonomonas macrotermitis]SHE30085.1 recombination protein RecT [Dysgonomonas macrotermitis]
MENNKLQTQQLPKSISDSVLQRVTQFREAGELRLPPDYSPENALKAAHLVLLETKNKDGKLALEVCSKESIANALLKMIVLGLSVMKKQCDFIVRGTQLCCDPEYTGNIALAMRYGGLKHHKGNAIFNGDDFKFEVGVDGRRKLIHHKQDLASIGGDVIGAYVTYELEDGTQDMEIMNINQIRNSWLQGAAKGGSIAHKNFTDQMAIKTVYNRMTKLLIRASNDAPLMGDNGSDDNEQKPDVVSEAKQEVLNKANAEEIAFEDIPNEAPQAATEPEPAQQQEAPAQSTNSQTEIPY